MDEEPELETGIHGNTYCLQCGACCYYYKVLNDDNTVLKKGYSPCQFMEYDFRKKKAACSIHDSPSRPTDCSTIKFCSPQFINGDLSGYDLDILKLIAQQMPELMKGIQKK